MAGIEQNNSVHCNKHEKPFYLNTLIDSALPYPYYMPFLPENLASQVSPPPPTFPSPTVGSSVTSVPDAGQWDSATSLR